MTDQSLVRSKAFSMRAIMSSPLADVIFDAINAPSGSTKKTRAKSVLKSFQQSHQNYLANNMMQSVQDGQGGGGTIGLDMTGNLPLGNSPLAQYAPKYNNKPLTLNSNGSVNSTTIPALTARPTPTATSLTLLATPTPPSTPTTTVTPFGTFTNTPASQPPTIGPTGSLVPSIPGVAPTITPKTPFALPATPTVPSGLTFYRDSKSTDLYNATTGIKIGATDWANNWSGKAKEVPAPVKIGQPVTSATHVSQLEDQSKSQWTQEGANQIYNQYISAGYTPTEASKRVKELSTFTPVSTASTINPAKLTEDNAYDVLNNLANSSGTSELDTWYKSLSLADQTRLKVPYESVKAGEGPSSFSMRILANKNLLGTVLGLPKEVLDSFPDTGLLSDQLNTLQDTVNKQFHLDEQLTNLTSMQNSGLTVKSDLQAYIRGKDEYLGKLDKMLDDFNYKTAYMDTSDPNVAKRMDNYRNYLTILQGRQNMRYIDFLNTAIDSENAKLTQATNLYNLSLTKAEQAFTRAERVTTESYGLIKGSLEDMYKNINDRTKMARDNESYQLEKMKTYYQLIEQMKKVDKMGKDTYAVTKAELEASKGDDGFVNTDKYKELRDKAKDKTGFDKSFNYLLNPNDPTAQGFIKQESTPAWMVDSAIWQWLSMDETKKLSDEEKAQYIKEAGRNPESFGLYGY